MCYKHTLGFAVQPPLFPTVADDRLHQTAAVATSFLSFAVLTGWNVAVCHVTLALPPHSSVSQTIKHCK